ncbi:MAG: hypothetical protein COX81_02990 [Candidatus Magasanikbacteria bacterium CG_4_10_14_0_2_um_filter_37_12]|uniref:DoxX family protein n=1 Tax=Candidatus Magasanikbacteria bacterium CG_4_10_14_0_2_um_filter_37_12 TaxID=1974637 RepID=A0A2M7V7J4_9BACT|nr:MAG: hypothetical protein COX81_02990 [Candidatus Magasanikbacteria bacterium CG_4_10_14_0_2_um_filter_37_12]
MFFKKQEIVWVLLRIGMGWIFLWAFFDKLFGLGFGTASDQSWLDGVSPTAGFLKFGTHGPFAGIFQSLTSNFFVEWLFMVGLLLIGLSLILGIGMKIASYSGSLLLFLMWLATFPPKNNPIIDQHLVYICVLIVLTQNSSSKKFSLDKWWGRQKIVQKFSVLR